MLFRSLGEDTFAKHGTRVATIMVVVDKINGSGRAPTVHPTSIAHLLPLLEALPKRAPCQSNEVHIQAHTPAITPKPAGGLFAGFTSPKRVAKPDTARPNMAVLPVAYTALDTPAPLAEQIGMYLPYRPSRINFAHAGEHPTLLVESIAMGSIAAPIPSYVPRLPAHSVEARILSSAQLETTVYAGQAHETYLPGTYVLPDKGLELSPDAGGQRYRQGFFLGDGTGAGKGRQLAAIILDQWLKGNQRHIWISDNNALLEDARRDWSALGGIALDIQPLTNWKPGQAITLCQGVLFLSYAGLRSQTGEHSRLKQILDWAGVEFEGVAVFDEAHAMGGVSGGEGRFGATKGSEQGIAGVMLQHKLPNARIVYSSATGASDINNLSYAVRLGLWGAQTAFATREQFISEIRQGGIAAMELVARELKGLGLYCARALSYAGVEYDILEHRLTPGQIADFDTYADAWGIIHRNLEAALALTNVTDPLEKRTLNSGALAAARSRFESCKQRFFGQLLLSMKLPSLLPAIAEARASGHSVVVQLVSTAEAMLDRRIAALTPDERADLCVDLSPREYISDYLVRAFPVRQMESYFDSEGKEYSRPMFDADDNPVISPEAVRMRDALIEMLCAMPPITSALDAIIMRFGADAVAEITGRTRRLITQGDGSQTLEARSHRSNIVETQRFMSGEKSILVFSDAGGTGRSYHASLEAANQQRRVHF